MRKLFNILGNGLGFLLLVGLIIILIFSLNGIQQGENIVGTFKSPASTPILESEPTPAAIATTENFSGSPLASPTPVATKTTEEPTSTPEVIPTLTGPFPAGPKLVYSENIRDEAVTFWAVSPINPSYRLPLAKGSDPNFFGINAALSPNGKMIAYTALPEWNYDNRLAADLWLVTIDGNEQRLLAKGIDFGGPGYPYWSPDSHYIAFVRSTETEDTYETVVWIIDITTNVEIMVGSSDDDKKFAWPIGWAGDGVGLYYRSQNEVYFFSKQANSSTFAVSLPSSTFDCKLSPDSTQTLCSILADREKGIYELATIFLQGKESSKSSFDVIRQFQGENFISIWGPRNQSITVSENLPAAENTTLQIIESDTKNVTDMKLQTSGNYFPRSWSPDGTWLVTQNVSRSYGDLYFFSNNGQTINHLPTQGATDVLGWLMIDLASR